MGLDAVMLLAVAETKPFVPIGWWTLLAIDTSVILGVCATFLSTRLRGHRRFGYRKLVRVEFEAFVWVATIDAAGALVAVFSFWLALPARSSWLLSLARQSPGLFWAGVGAPGPLIAIGLLKQAPASLALAPSRNRPQAVLRDLRRTFSHDIYRTAGHLTRTWEVRRDDWLNGEARSLHNSGQLSFDELADAVLKTNKKDPSRFPLPARWSTFQNERKGWPTIRDPTDCTLRLVESALRAGFTAEVAEACRLDLTQFKNEVRPRGESPPQDGPSRSEERVIEELQDLEGISEELD